MIVLRITADVPRHVGLDGRQHEFRVGDVVGGLPFSIAKVLVGRGAAVVLKDI